MRQKVVELFNKGFTPQEIQQELGLRYWQPVYNVLKKAGIYEKRSTRYHRKYFFNENYFDNINTEDKAYFFGFLAADGCIDSDAQRVKIALQEKDSDILYKMVSYLNANFEPKFVKHHSYNQVHLCLNSKVFRHALIQKGMKPRKSLTMSAELTDSIPEHLIRHFLRGYCDGDGNIFLGKRYKSGVKFSVSVIGTKEFLKSSFLKHCSSNSPLSKYNSCEMWCWKTAKIDHVFEFLKYIYQDATVYLDRKYKYVGDYVTSECAHIKSGELLEIFLPKAKDNQQPSLLAQSK